MKKLNKKSIEKKFSADNVMQMSVCNSCGCSSCGNGCPGSSTCKGCYDSDVVSESTKIHYNK